MNKLIFSLKFYILFLFCAVIAYSCCRMPTQVTIVGDGEISFVSLADRELGITDTISSSEFSIYANFELLFVEEETLVDFNLIPLAYSTSCEEEYQNSFDQATFSLSTNRDFVYDGNNISAGENIGSLPELVINFSQGSISVLFPPAFNDKANFNNGENIFTISIATSDGLNLMSDGAVVFNY